MQEEIDLLQRAMAGDADALISLLTREERKLYALCLRMLGSREDAEDALQEIMVRIWRRMPSYQQRSQFSTWVYRIATNTCLDLLRKRKGRDPVSLDALEEVGASVQDTGLTPHAAAEAAARRACLERAITSLKPDLRAALVLRDVQGFSYEEVASILNLPLGTVKSRINRAREDLRETLLSQGELFDRPRVYANEGRRSV